MSNEAKLKKLLLLEGLCESLRSSVFEEEEYRRWALQRLGRFCVIVYVAVYLSIADG